MGLAKHIVMVPCEQPLAPFRWSLEAAHLPQNAKKIYSKARGGRDPTDKHNNSKTEVQLAIWAAGGPKGGL